jgi:hypothetical protein
MISRDPTNLWRRHRRRELLKNALAFGILACAVAAYWAWGKFGGTIAQWAVGIALYSHLASRELVPSLGHFSVDRHGDEAMPTGGPAAGIESMLAMIP